MNIRLYTKRDFTMISEWWQKANEIGPLETMLPLDSTFILEHQGRPLLCVSLFLTNISEYCIVENFIGNPDCKGPLRRESHIVLLKHVEHFARDRGYKRLFCLAHKGPLVKRYQEIGFVQTGSEITSFVKLIN